MLRLKCCLLQICGGTLHVSPKIYQLMLESGIFFIWITTSDLKFLRSAVAQLVERNTGDQRVAS